jgi:hypothetical protein
LSQWCASSKTKHPGKWGDEGHSIRQSDVHFPKPCIAFTWLSDENMISVSDVHSLKRL